MKAKMPHKHSACPFIHTIHFPAASFTWTHEGPHEARLDTFEVTGKPWKHRKRCMACGSNVASYNIRTDCWSIWGATLARDEEGKIKNWDQLRVGNLLLRYVLTALIQFLLQPTAHMFYGTRMLDIQDELGKWAGYENKSDKM